MARLGAQRTIKGYLNEVVEKALLFELNDEPISQQMERNWDEILGGLWGKWDSRVFTWQLFDFHRGKAWGFAHRHKRGPLGREDHSIFCAPSVVDLVSPVSAFGTDLRL